MMLSTSMSKCCSGSHLQSRGVLEQSGDQNWCCHCPPPCLLKVSPLWWEKREQEMKNAYGGWSTDAGWEGWIGMRGTEVDLGKWRELSSWPHNSARRGHIQRQQAAAVRPLPPPSSCCLPQCTKNIKHVVLTMGEEHVSCLQCGDIESQGLRTGRSQSGCCVTTCICIWAVSSQYPSLIRGGQDSKSQTPALPRFGKWQRQGHHIAGPREGPK